MTDIDSGVFAVICEFKNQAPILMETEGHQSSFEACEKRRRDLEAQTHVIRACVVRIADGPSWCGNSLLLADMKRMQK